MLQGRRYRNYLLHEWNAKMLGQRKSAGAGNHRRSVDCAQFEDGSSKQIGKSLLNIRKMPFIIGKGDIVILIHQGDFYRGGADINS